MVNFDTLQVNSYAQRDRFRRITQRDIDPGAVKPGKLQGFIFGTETANASVAMANADNINLSTSITQNDEYELQGNNYIALYVDSVTAANQIFPSVGDSQDITEWQITGPAYDWHDWNTSSFAKHIEYSTLNIENISAGAVTLYIRSKWRYISPREGA